MPRNFLIINASLNQAYKFHLQPPVPHLRPPPLAWLKPPPSWQTMHHSFSLYISTQLTSTTSSHIPKTKAQTIRKERKKPINQKTWIAYGHGYVNSLSLKSGTSHPHNSSSHSRFPNRVDTVAPPNQSNSERTGSPGQTRTNC